MGLSCWGFNWIRLQVGGAPLDKLSVVVPPVAANAKHQFSYLRQPGFLCMAKTTVICFAWVDMAVK